MFNKDNVFIAVNEEVSSIIQQYIIREIKKVLDRYNSITTEEINKQYKQWRVKGGIPKWLEYVSKDSKRNWRKWSWLQDNFYVPKSKREWIRRIINRSCY